jgi:hypothetical protein
MSEMVSYSVCVERELLDAFVATAHEDGQSAASVMRSEIKKFVLKQARGRQRAKRRSEVSRIQASDTGI